MTNKEYEAMVEEKFGKKLQDTMYDLCVVQQVEPYKGANILGVPKKTFVTWRSKFGYGPIQQQVAIAERNRQEQVAAYSEELKDVDLLRPFQLHDEVSLNGFREFLQRNLELYKARRIMIEPVSMGEIMLYVEIEMVKKAMQWLDSYTNGDYQESFSREAKVILAQMNSGVNLDEQP